MEGPGHASETTEMRTWSRSCFQVGLATFKTQANARATLTNCRSSELATQISYTMQMPSAHALLKGVAQARKGCVQSSEGCRQLS